MKKRHNKYVLTKLILAAAEAGIPEAIQIALDHGVDVNASDRFNITPLHKAVHHNHVEAVRLLIQKKADPDRVNITGQSPRMWAEENKNEEILHILNTIGPTD